MQDGQDKKKKSQSDLPIPLIIILSILHILFYFLIDIVNICTIYDSPKMYILRVFPGGIVEILQSVKLSQEA